MLRQIGFSLLELVTVIAIISILGVVALDRLLPYIDEAERVSVLRVEGQLRSTLTMEAAIRIVRGQSASIPGLAGSNPVNFLARPPTNYVGALFRPQATEVSPRHWYFDEASRQLVYRLGEAFALRKSDETLEDPAFMVRVAFADTDGDGRFEASRDELYGVHLERVAGTQWLAGSSSN